MFEIAIKTPALIEATRAVGEDVGVIFADAGRGWLWEPGSNRFSALAADAVKGEGRCTVNLRLLKDLAKAAGSGGFVLASHAHTRKVYNKDVTETWLRVTGDADEEAMLVEAQAPLAPPAPPVVGEGEVFDARGFVEMLRRAVKYLVGEKHTRAPVGLHVVGGYVYSIHTYMCAVWPNVWGLQDCFIEEEDVRTLNKTLKTVKGEIFIAQGEDTLTVAQGATVVQVDTLDGATHWNPSPFLAEMVEDVEQAAGAKVRDIKRAVKHLKKKGARGIRFDASRVVGGKGDYIYQEKRTPWQVCGAVDVSGLVDTVSHFNPDFLLKSLTGLRAADEVYFAVEGSLVYVRFGRKGECVAFAMLK